MRISHEAIYQALFIQGRGALRRELTACLRTGRTLRMPRGRVGLRGKNFVSPDIMISQRPAEADDRAVPGHWEGDLILGLDSSAIGTLVERTTCFTMLLHLPRMEGYGAGPSIKNGPALAEHGAEAVRDGTVRISVCGRAVEHYAAMALMKRSPKITANCALAMVHSRGGISHSFSDRFKIR